MGHRKVELDCMSKIAGFPVAAYMSERTLPAGPRVGFVFGLVAVSFGPEVCLDSRIYRAMVVKSAEPPLFPDAGPCRAVAGMIARIGNRME